MENWYIGLWQACVIQDEVGDQCKGYDSFLALPSEIRISRILMFISNAVGLLGLLISSLGLDCVKMKDVTLDLRKRLRVFGGVLFWIAGITTIFPVSLVAHRTVVEFWDDTIPELVPRWEFGEAIFTGWFSGFFLIVGGALMICTTCTSEKQLLPVHYASSEPYERDYLETATGQVHGTVRHQQIKCSAS